MGNSARPSRPIPSRIARIFSPSLQPPIPVSRSGVMFPATLSPAGPAPPGTRTPWSVLPPHRTPEAGFIVLGMAIVTTHHALEKIFSVRDPLRRHLHLNRRRRRYGRLAEIQIAEPAAGDEKKNRQRHAHNLFPHPSILAENGQSASHRNRRDGIRRPLPLREFSGPGAQVVGATSTRPESRDAFASKYGIRSFASVAEMLPEIDVLDICTPPHRTANISCRRPRPASTSSWRSR